MMSKTGNSSLVSSTTWAWRWPLRRCKHQLCAACPDIGRQGQQLSLCKCCKIRRDLQFLYRIVELEGTFRNHLDQLYGHLRAKQELKCNIESIIQMLLGYWREALAASFQVTVKWKLSLVLTKWQILSITQNGLSPVLQLSWWRVFVVTLKISRISINFCNPHWKLTQSLA